MIYGLSKADVDKLPEEQREMIARIAMDQARHERKVRENAEGYFGYRLIPIILLLIATVLGMLRPAGFLSFFIIGLAGMIQFHAIGINKRIDAVLKLMDLSREEQTRRQEDSISQPAGDRDGNRL